MPSSAPDPVTQPTPLVMPTGGRLRLILAALMLTLFLAALDQTIVATALPRITSDLGGLAQLSWVVTAYLLASTASAPVWGKVSDIHGRKATLQVAIIVFLIGSALAGAASSMPWLIATRFLQGLGGGGLMVLVMAVIADVIPPADRGRYTGLFGSVFAVSSIAGPLLGGWLVDAASWRWIFYVNVPLGLAAIAVLGAVLHVPQHRVDHRIDYAGAGLLVTGVVAALLALEWGGRQYPWASAPIIGLAAAAAGLLAAFVWHQRRTPEPLVPMTLFGNRVFSVASALGFVVGMGMFGAIVYVPLYLQVVQGSSPAQAGLQMLPLMAGMLTMSVLSGRLISRIGRYRMFPIIGTALATIGLLALSRLQPGTGYPQLAVALLILGCGLGNVMQVLVLAVQNAVRPHEIGVATSGTAFFRSMGGTVGTALFGAILADQLATRLAGAPPGAAEAGSSLGAIAALPPAAKAAVLDAFSSSMDVVFLAAVPALAVGFVLALLLPDAALRTRRDAAAAE